MEHLEEERQDKSSSLPTILLSPWLRAILIGLPSLVMVLLVIYPLTSVLDHALTGKSLLYSGAHGFGAVFLRVLESRQFHSELVTSLTLAIMATVGCLFVGFGLGLVLSFVPFPGSRIVAAFIDTYIAFPGFLIALSFTFIYGSHGMLNALLQEIFRTHNTILSNFTNTRWAVAFALMTYYTPFVLRQVQAAFSQIDGALIEAASNLGAGPGRIVWRIILPEAVPALLAGGGLALVLTLNDFGIVSIMGAKGVTTLTMQIYGQAIINNEVTIAAVTAVAGAMLSLSAYFGFHYLVMSYWGRSDANPL